MRHTLHRFGVGDGNGNIMITLENLIKVIKMFHYNCTQVDQNELRFWVLNNRLIVDAPQHFREDVIFLDTKKIIKCLKFEYRAMGFIGSSKSKTHANTMGEIYEDARDHLLLRKCEDLVNVLEIFKRNALKDMIGERELRKVLYEYLA